MMREGSHSASRVVDVLQKIKSPKEIKVPEETLDMIDKVIRRKMYHLNKQDSRSGSKSKREK